MYSLLVEYYAAVWFSLSGFSVSKHPSSKVNYSIIKIRSKIIVLCHFHRTFQRFKNLPWATVICVPGWTAAYKKSKYGLSWAILFVRIKYFCIFLLSTLYEHPCRAEFELFITAILFWGWNYSWEANLSFKRVKTKTEDIGYVLWQ